MVNVVLLKDKMKATGMTTTFICNKSNILRQTLYNRFINPDLFTVVEVDSLKKTLRLSTDEVNEIFFANDVESH